MVSVKQLNETCFGLWYKDDWLPGPTNHTPLQHPREDVLDRLAGHLNSLGEAPAGGNSGDDEGFRIHEPFATLYQMLSWRTSVEEGWSFVDAKPNWVFSCDPVFHPSADPDLRALQIEHFSPVVGLLGELGCCTVELPPLQPETPEDWEDLERNPAYRLPEDCTARLHALWNSLKPGHKAAAHHLYEDCLEGVPSMSAIILFLTGKLNPAGLANVFLAAGGIFPGMEDCSEEEYEQSRARHIRAASLARKTAMEI